YALDDGIGIVGQAEQQWRLLGEDLADAAGGVFRAAAITGQAAAPGVGLRVEVIEVGERAGGEEGVAHEPNGFFHAALLVAAGDRDGAGLVTVMPGEVEQDGVEADRVAVTLEHGAAQVV